ncbi:DUF5620 domain-containing protein [uncultured Ruminococcus sp.]|uniref:DUF5620 domain-containing protein n=1 Tax=uncultured Ruminococcus sp. TaxID=165186 RepID=UPI00260A1700|nr:DUF5620 domain-containing protein [uncultured Ruminococcus sp.]
MSKTFHKRVKALLVSAVMAASSVAVTSGGAFFVEAAGSEVAIGKTLVTADPDPENPKGDPLNATECTFMCKAATDTWTKFTDTKGKSPEDLLGTDTPKTLQFNLKADQMVTDFSYYFGCAADEAHDYYWDTNTLTEDGEAIQCHPYATEFSVVVEIPSYANLGADGKFQFQNCYTGLIDETDQKTRTQDAEITLVSITVNGTTDTGEGTPPEWINSDDDLPGGAENTGGLYYSSANGGAASYSVEQSGDSCTVKTLNSLKIDGLDIKLTTGDNCSEEYYASEEFAAQNGGKILESEEAIREAGLPLNSHKFTYADFNFLPGTTVSAGAKVKSLSLTLKTADNTNVSRVMYGGGLNVEYMSLADTEYAKMQAGLKDNSLAGYWYNDIGGAALKACTDAGVDWGNGKGEFEVGGGSDLAKQELGSYFTVTWDVPEQVVNCVTTKTTDQISFQLWYAELVEGDFTDATIVDATLTYEESMTFPCTGTASVKNAGSASVGKTVSIPYADFGMQYEKTADVYAVQFDVTTSDEANQVQVGAGTSVLEKLGMKDNWCQADDIFVGESGNASHPILLYWEKTTAGSRPKASDDTVAVAPYEPAKGTKTYTYMWIIPPAVAAGQSINSETGATKSAWNNVNAEEEGSHVDMGVWYANLGETVSDSFSIDNVTVYYAADDVNNSAKGHKFEDTLSVVDSIDVQIGETATLEINVPGCTILSKDKTIASAKLSDGQNATVSGKNVGTTTLTITTPGGQTAEVTVNVLAEVTTETTETTTSTTTTTTTTTTTAKTTTATSKTTTTGSQTTAELKALYGDVNVDGRVDITDAVLLNKAAAGAVKLSAQATLNADCNADDELGNNDAIILLKFLVSLIKALPSAE